MSKPKIIIAYDGDCGFCSKSVQFVLNRDKNKIFFFTPLSSTTGKSFQDELGITDTSTMILKLDDKYYTKTSASLMICRYLPLPWKLLYPLIIIPKFLRDPFYNIIARNRYKLAGETCLLPTEEQKQQFIFD